MAIIYSPLLLVTAALETREAKWVRQNRHRKATDDDTIEEWEQLEDQCDFEAEGWAKKVDETKPNVEVAGTILEVKKLKAEMEELKGMLTDVLKRLDS
jgi:hypothetical protein